jgi:hypothetical protein
LLGKGADATFAHFACIAPVGSLEQIVVALDASVVVGGDLIAGSSNGVGHSSQDLVLLACEDRVVALNTALAACANLPGAAVALGKVGKARCAPYVGGPGQPPLATVLLGELSPQGCAGAAAGLAAAVTQFRGPWIDPATAGLHLPGCAFGGLPLLFLE